ncbi:MAG: nucleotidyl transferase AbiEii/AbiGii toxin family protein [Proteobacteria bacterium]|nr:nucleotidyl transferase AbiEii/AbiGii toxin family protein [Pseudomonadota bacterium]
MTTSARYTQDLDFDHDPHLHLTVEVSRRRAPDLSHVLKVPIQIADRTLPRVYVSVYDEQALADNKVAALLDERRTAPRDIYDLELLLSRGICPSPPVIQQFGGQAKLTGLISTKLDLMGWALFRDQVLPALPRETQANIDEEEYLAMKLRLLNAIEQCLLRQPDANAQT